MGGKNDILLPTIRYFQVPMLLTGSWIFGKKMGIKIPATYPCNIWNAQTGLSGPPPVAHHPFIKSPVWACVQMKDTLKTAVFIGNIRIDHYK